MDRTNGAILVQEMVSGTWELAMGITRNPQFGRGGKFIEILTDVSFRIAPLEERDAFEMMQEIKGRKILKPVRGMAGADKYAIARMLVSIGRFALENDGIKEIDMNPVILSGHQPVTVDAL